MPMPKSTKSKLFLSALLLIFFIPLFSLSGCGGSTGSSTTTGETTTTDLSSLTLSFSADFVVAGAPVTITATLRGASGALVSTHTQVTFAQDSTNLVAFIPPIGTALTTNGVATIQVTPASQLSAGASSITASAPVTTGGTTATVTSAPVGIYVGGATDVSLHSLTLGSPSISAYGSSSVSALVWINGAPATVPIAVTFDSPCVENNMATLTSPVTTILGTAISTYKDKGCASGTDLITATVTGVGSLAQTITVAIPATNNIQFSSATPTILGITGSPLPQSSLVEFQVLDNYGNGKPGVLVDFTLLPLAIPGGVNLSPSSAISDASGNVTTSVNTGTVPTPVWVLATVHGTSLLTQSNTLTITTGLPTQDFFSLALSSFNIEGLDYDGVTSTLTVIASDRLGNPVPEQTAINFITPVSGQILPASCLTSSGICTVTYKSSGARPANGRVTLLAYAPGEKSFIDANGNNSYDAGETFYDLGDMYIDANEDGLWDNNEQFFSSPNSGSSACLTQPGGTLLPASYANVPSKDGTCSGEWGISYVRRSAVLVLSGSTAHIAPTTVHMASSCNKQFILILTDINGNPMPATTALAPALNYVNYTPNGSTSSSAATITIPYGTPVASTNHLGGTSFTLSVFADCSAGTPVSYPQGTVNINVTTPKGNLTGIPITVVNP